MGKRHHRGNKAGVVGGRKVKEEPKNTAAKKATITSAVWENLKPERPELLEFLREQRKGKKTLCILGTSPDNCNLAPWGEGLDMWGVNDGHRLAYMDGHWDDITAWFQIHHRWRWMLSKQIAGTERWRYGIAHYEFLRDESLKFPIYMQQRYEDVPRSVRFPLREVTEQLMYKKIQRGYAWQRKYYTSSFGFMMALALADLPGFPGPYDRIEMYGVQLAQKVEYQMQKPNTEFWIGMALGKGKEVYIPENGYILSGETYGYRLPHGDARIGQIDEDNVGFWDWGDRTSDLGYRGVTTWG